MPVINRIAEFHDLIAGWRRQLHAHPELLYDVDETAARVAGMLKEFGVDQVVTGLGRTGVVGVIAGRRQTSGRVIGLRADMDALPILERTGKPYASLMPGRMHACGHDGHTAMLLGAAKYLAETRNFDGTAVVIFQPAEEGGAGGKAMLEDGLIDRFGIQEVYGLHNIPGQPAGTFAIRPGPIMAATDEFIIEVEGKGSHAAKPHNAIDPIVVAAHLVVALQTLVSRTVDPMMAAVVSVTILSAGTAHNIIPRTARLQGTVRTLNERLRTQLEARLRALVGGIAGGFGARAEVTFRRGYPITVNAPAQTGFAAQVAQMVVGRDRVDEAAEPLMGGEDFAYMLAERPGAYILLGNGDTSELHTDTYDFNDEIIPIGVSYWVKLIETAMPL